jgi:hypothetical protein
MKTRLLLAASLGLAVLVAWALWPAASGPAGPSLTERARETAVRADSLAAKIISGEDLPPEGTRSLFDHLIAQNEVLPYPFEKLVALIQSQHPEAKLPVSLMIPLGRSLLKAQADFGHPRVLAGADFQSPNTGAALGFAPRGQLFLGFVENAAEIEVISYNEAAGRFEFQLVQDYRAGGVPRIVYARRAICTTCHQGAAPIFPQRPWNETNGQPEIAAGLAEARKSDAPYLGLPLMNTLAAPERFDELTDVGNFIPVVQRIWLDGCGEAGADCRRQMLKLALRFALSPGDFDADSKDAARLRELQAAHWPKEGIAVSDSDIRNRDPLAETRGVRGFFRALFTPKSAEPGARSNEDLGAFEKLPRLPAVLDPLTPRAPKRVLGANDVDGVFGLAQFFTQSDMKLLDQAAGFERKALEAAAGRLPAEFFAPAPFARVKTVNALLQAMKQKPRDYAFLDTSEMSPPVTLGVPPLALAENSPLKPFEAYCFACHRGNPARRLNFMGGKTEDEVLASIKDTAAIRDVLDWQRYRGTDKEATLMPPADSHQRRELEQAISRGEPVLEEMRKVVPGLFDF